MPDRRAPNLFTIPSDRGFADALAEGIIAQYGGDRMAMARGVVLTANSRSVRAITEAFVRRAENGLLLPRLVTIGDADLEENAGLIFDADVAAPLPPAIEPLRRHLILARLIQKAHADPLDAAAALRLAADLARALDQLKIEEIDPARVNASLVKEELSEHWQKSLDLFDIVTKQWPRELARLGRLDLVDRRNQLLNRAADGWARHPPASFVVAAGISTAAPAIARLLKTVAHLEHGAVVFSGIDLTMPENEWDYVRGKGDERAEEAHPQFHLAQILDRMDAARDDVREWDWGKPRSDRAGQTSHAMAPARFTRRWSNMPAEHRRLRDVKLAVFSGPADEAQGIAIAMREVLETPQKTVALITPDRALAMRVSAHLKRWGIDADDSAGVALSSTLPGSLIVALATAAAEAFAPVALLGLLKHPLVQQGDNRRLWMDGARALDLALRGPRPAPGLAGVSAFLASGTKYQRDVRDRASAWWREALPSLEPLEAAFSNRRLSLPMIAATLREAATVLSGDAAWKGPAGKAVADLIDRFESHSVDGPGGIAVTDTPEIIGDLLDGETIRPAWGGHHRVFILGLIEARLQSADVAILGGLNEGVWPNLPAPDPWLAPKIRTELGLPCLEYRISLAAHDFAAALGNREVIITRALRDASAPTNESRFLLRLNAFTGGLDQPLLSDFARMIDGHKGKPETAAKPMPAPPASERPKEMRVTEADGLKSDPFAWYARRMMGLSRLDAIDAEATGAWRGTMIHEALERWAKDDGYAAGALVSRVQAEFDKPETHKLLATLWQPQIVQACEWIELKVAELRADGRTPGPAEISGDTSIDGVNLIGKADRIDLITGGELAIVDYKTGSSPTQKQAIAGFAMQLGLIGLIAARGGFKGVAGDPSLFEYWKLNRDQGSGRFGGISKAGLGKDATQTLVEKAEESLKEAIADFINGDNPFEPRLHPEWVQFGDYDQLSRLEEWYGR